MREVLSGRLWMPRWWVSDPELGPGNNRKMIKTDLEIDKDEQGGRRLHMIGGGRRLSLSKLGTKLNCIV